MNRILTMFLLVAAITTWTVETMNRERLVKRLDQARLTIRPLSRAKTEHEDLLRRQPFVGEVEGLRRDRAELVGLRREHAHRLQSTEAAKAAIAALGHELLPVMLWLPTAAMKNMGRATPHATLQTFFWAAASEDVPALQEILTIETEPPPEVPHQPSADAKRGTAEAQAAEWLVQRPPFGEVQVMVERLKGFDEAVEFLALRRPDGQVTAIPLRFRWEAGGWRVIVPGHVIGAPSNAATSNPLQGAPRLPEP